MATVYLLQAEHFDVPGIITKVFASEAGANAEAASLANLMVVDTNFDDAPEKATAENWGEVLEWLQNVHGARDCYIEVMAQSVQSDDYAASRAWAKTLTDRELSAALEEMRSRGAAVAIYDAGEVNTMFDGSLFAIEPEDWFDDDGNRAALEEAMCEAAREIFVRELEPSEDEEDDDD